MTEYEKEKKQQIKMKQQPHTTYIVWVIEYVDDVQIHGFISFGSIEIFIEQFKYVK